MYSSKRHQNDNLFFDLQLKAHPYTSSYHQYYEPWCNIRLLHVSNHEEIVLSKFEWDIFPLADWFLEMYDALLKQKQFFVIDPTNNQRILPRPEESLAQAYYRFREKVFDDELFYDMWLDSFSMDGRHFLGCAFPGSEDKINLFVGLRNGLGEISSPYDEWKHQFNMKLFLSTLKNSLLTIISNWFDSFTPHHSNNGDWNLDNVQFEKYVSGVIASLEDAYFED